METAVDRSTYGAYVKAARTRAKLTMEEAAKRAGMTYDGLSKIERNVTGAKMSTLERLANVYGCLIGDLLPNSGQTAQNDLFEPLLASMAGMTDEEIVEQILVLASQVRLNRNMLRRATTRPLGAYNPALTNPTGDEIAQRYGVDEGADANSHGAVDAPRSPRPARPPSPVKKEGSR